MCCTLYFDIVYLHEYLLPVALEISTISQYLYFIFRAVCGYVDICICVVNTLVMVISTQRKTSCRGLLWLEKYVHSPRAQFAGNSCISWSSLIWSKFEADVMKLVALLPIDLPISVSISLGHPSIADSNFHLLVSVPHELGSSEHCTQHFSCASAVSIPKTHVHYKRT